MTKEASEQPHNFFRSRCSWMTPETASAVKNRRVARVGSRPLDASAATHPNAHRACSFSFLDERVSTRRDVLDRHPPPRPGVGRPLAPSLGGRRCASSRSPRVSPIPRASPRRLPRRRRLRLRGSPRVRHPRQRPRGRRGRHHHQVLPHQARHRRQERRQPRDDRGPVRRGGHARHGQGAFPLTPSSARRKASSSAPTESKSGPGSSTPSTAPSPSSPASPCGAPSPRSSTTASPSSASSTSPC